MIRRALIGLAAASALLFVAVPAADASIIAGTGAGGGCAPQNNIIAGNPALEMFTVQLPGGPASNIQAFWTFVTYCQPQDGTVYLDLQQKQIVNGHVIWAPQDEVSRDLGQLLPKGWQLTTAKVFCSGRHTYRSVLTWHGHLDNGQADQNPDGGIFVPNGGGQIFQCIKYGG